METSFASRVRDFRKHKGLSQQAFAERCGLDQSNITQMEKGTDPKQSNAVKLLAGFPDLNPDWLLLGTGEMLRGGQGLSPAPSIGVTLDANGIVTSSARPDLIPIGAIRQADGQFALPPTPGLTSGPATVAEAENVLLREQVADLRQQVARLWSLSGLMEKLGKMPSNLDAAVAMIREAFGRQPEMALP